MSFNRIVITGANSLFFDSLLTAISSVHQHGASCVDAIVVYDFGMTESEKDTLSDLHLVSVVDASYIAKENIPAYRTVSTDKTKCHFLKMFALHHARDIAENVLWMDAGAAAIGSLKEIFETIENEDIFLVGDAHLNSSYTHKRCVEIMAASETEMSAKQLWSGLVGFKSKGRFAQMLDDGWRFAQVDGCIDGYLENHRHDQSVLSILAERYKCPVQDINKYGYWTDSDRSVDSAFAAGALVLVHRRSYSNKEHLSKKLKYSKPRLQLPDVTLLCADCVDVDRALAAIKKCTDVCDFGNVVFLSSLGSTAAFAHLIRHFPTLNDYSVFMAKYAHEYVSTSHCLVVQHDGWIINPDTWNPKWLSYDYIGPLYIHSHAISSESVGSGGFSLRSKRLMQHVAASLPEWAASVSGTDFQAAYMGCHEDGYFTHRHRYAGFFAPPEEAIKFAYGGQCADGTIYEKPFGFHGWWTNINTDTGRVSGHCPYSPSAPRK